MRSALDPRTTAARPDIAAAHLRGRVQAERFVDGEPFTVGIDVLDLKKRPRPDAPLDTQLLYGETLVVYEDDNGWGWAQADRDGYVGYVAMSALDRGATPATHRVIVRRAHVYPAPDMKQPVIGALPLDGRVRVEGTRGAFVEIKGRGFVVASHVAPIDRSVDQALGDPVAVAEGLIGTPYLWGGRSPLGIDCSGLVQLAFSVTGTILPRDTDMQVTLGSAVATDASLAGLRRGDLVFWPGHVGVMSDEATLLHANAHHMLVAAEPLRLARDRIAAGGAVLSSIRRLRHATNFSIGN